LAVKWFQAVAVAAVVGASGLCSLPARAQDAPADTSAGVGKDAPGAQAASGPVSVGAKITVKKPVSIARLAAHPEKYAGRTVLLSGTVKEVCQGMGCWVEVQSGKASFMARSLDETVLLPKDCKGRRIAVQGVVKALPREAAEEGTPKDHVCPRPSYVVATQGAELK
jgi:hypothetical protein